MHVSECRWLDGMTAGSQSQNGYARLLFFSFRSVPTLTLFSGRDEAGLQYHAVASEELLSLDEAEEVTAVECGADWLKLSLNPSLSGSFRARWGQRSRVVAGGVLWGCGGAFVRRTLPLADGSFFLWSASAQTMHVRTRDGQIGEAFESATISYGPIDEKRRGQLRSAAARLHQEAVTLLPSANLSRIDDGLRQARRHHARACDSCLWSCSDGGANIASPAAGSPFFDGQPMVVEYKSAVGVERTDCLDFFLVYGSTCATGSTIARASLSVDSEALRFAGRITLVIPAESVVTRNAFVSMYNYARWSYAA